MYGTRKYILWLNFKVFMAQMGKNTKMLEIYLLLIIRMRRWIISSRSSESAHILHLQNVFSSEDKRSKPAFFGSKGSCSHDTRF
jgi:hypothetical protein